MIPFLLVFALSPTNSVPPPDLPQGSNAYYVGNRLPLKQPLLYKLPIGAIKPAGWLRVQLEDEANGETGHLEEISPWLNQKNNAWISSSGMGDHGWEEVPYWLKGFGDLGYILKDPRIISHAKVWIEGVLSSQRSNGYFGPECNLTANSGKPDVWPNMVMLFALQSYYEWSKDPRVLSFMSRYFKWEATIPDRDMFLSYWEKQRGGDNIANVFWLYNRTEESTLLDLVRKIHRVGADWVKGVPNWHGVNFAQGFREPAEFAELDASVPGEAATESDYQLMKSFYGQVPGGMYGADENARPGYHDPRQGTETCAMVEMMLSDEMLLTEDGDPKWADRCEDVAFNSLPAALTDDEKALHYLTAPNMVEADAKSKAPGFQNSGPMLLFNPYDHRCCQHNVSHGWPYFAEHLWLATNQNGLAAAMYAPNSVEATVGKGEKVVISEKTEYPFRDTVSFKIHTPIPTKFPFSVRVPSWAVGASFSLNGVAKPLPPGPCFFPIFRTWTDGDTVLLKFPMGIRVETWAQNGKAVSIERGPLAYGLSIGEKWLKTDGTKDFPATKAFPAWEVHPSTRWNFGLVPDFGRFKVLERPYNPSAQPFSQKNVPVEIRAPGRAILEWKVDSTGLCGPLQENPAKTTSPETMLTLIPMGAARLRISEFPTVSTETNAHRWIAPRVPIPASSSHTFEGDTLTALSSGSEPTYSHDQALPRFTWWDHVGSEEWVEYDFPKPRWLKNCSVYWYEDQQLGGRCRIPENWHLEVWENGKWSPAKALSNQLPGLMADRYNLVGFEPTKTSKLRIVASLRKGFSAGILQWKVE